MSLACMCETIDALGMTGFDKAYHNVQAFKDGKAPEMLTVSLLLLGTTIKQKDIEAFTCIQT